MTYLTNAWTTIETLCGDLWETSLNCHPHILAELDGEPARIKRGPTSKNRSGEKQHKKESKQVDLDLLNDYGFNIQDKMGLILKRRFSFNTLDGTREAYSRAFSRESSQIDRALSDKSLDALCSIRNLIVHKDGVIDQDYADRTRFFGSLPKSPVGDLVMLDGDIVVRLVKPAIAAASSLLASVDDWMIKHQN